MLNMGVATEVRAEAQQLGATTLSSILADLRVSGLAAPYPYLFEDGDADAPFDDHDHAPAQELAAAGDDDFGPNREIVFLRPADDDSDGVPDFEPDGALAWGADEISYVLTTGADGINVLERRINGQPGRVVARFVERVTFDDINTSGFEVPLGAVRVRIWFRLPDGKGGTFRYSVEATVRLRN
jgi:hypothetical protein